MRLIDIWCIDDSRHDANEKWKSGNFPAGTKKVCTFGVDGWNIYILFIHGITFGFIDLNKFGLNGWNSTGLRCGSCLQVEIAALRLILSERRRGDIYRRSSCSKWMGVVWWSVMMMDGSIIT